MPPSPYVRGPRLTLWPLENQHLPALQAIVSDTAVRNTWRTRGVYWAPFQLQAFLGRDVLVSAVATLGPGPEDPIVGLVEALDPAPIDGRAQLSAVVAPKYLGTALGIEMTLLFLAFAFEAYPFDKYQLEVMADNERLVPGLRRLLDHEGTFRRHLNIAGRWHDVHVFALWRSDLPRLQKRLGIEPVLGPING